MAWNWNHPRIIPVKFDDNPPSGLGGDLKQIDDGWRMTDIIGARMARVN